jgi:hypothetical protein
MEQNTNSRISKIEGAGDLGEHVVNVIRGKAIISETGLVKQSSPHDEKPPTEATTSSTETETLHQPF